MVPPFKTRLGVERNHLTSGHISEKKKEKKISSNAIKNNTKRQKKRKEKMHFIPLH